MCLDIDIDVLQTKSQLVYFTNYGAGTNLRSENMG